MARAPANRSGISTCTSSRGGPRTCCCSTGSPRPATKAASAKSPSASAVFSKASVLRRGGVVDHQLDRVAAAIVVAPEMAGEVDRAAARGGQEGAERGVDGAKGDRL